MRKREKRITLGKACCMGMDAAEEALNEGLKFDWLAGDSPLAHTPSP